MTTTTGSSDNASNVNVPPQPPENMDGGGSLTEEENLPNGGDNNVSSHNCRGAEEVEAVGVEDSNSEEAESVDRNNLDDENPEDAHDVTDGVGEEEQSLSPATYQQTTVKEEDDTETKIQEEVMIGLAHYEREPLPPPPSACTEENPMLEPPAKRVLEPEENTKLLVSGSDAPTNEIIGNSYCNEVNKFDVSTKNNHEHSDSEVDYECCDEGDEGSFVAVELISPKHSARMKDSSEESAINYRTDTTQQTTDSASNNPNHHAEHATVMETTKSKPPMEATSRINNNSNNIKHPSSSTLPPPQTIFSPPPRRKILRHPLLTPLTKLPWDKLLSGAGACDLLFNCKYSMRQVEDEVRAEARNNSNNAMVGGAQGNSNNNLLLGNGGVGYEGGQELHDDGVYDRVGRENGYSNCSLGNECGDFDPYGYDDGCDADEFADLGLDCCSMLDNEVDDEEVEVVAPGRLLLEQEAEDDVQAGEGDEEQDQDQTQSPLAQQQQQHSSANLMSDEMKEKISWKQSNPSLDMMFYRSMMSE